MKNPVTIAPEALDFIRLIGAGEGSNLYHVDADLSISGAPPSGFAAVLSHAEHKPLLIFSRTCGGAAP